MVSIPSGAFIENCPGPSTSKNPLNLSVTAVPEAATKNGSLSLMTSDEEDDSQEGDGGLSIIRQGNMLPRLRGWTPMRRYPSRPTRPHSTRHWQKKFRICARLRF
ncbi:uncharacterized protein LOC119770135 [Culex quinquefasciatus]|uniref:uncharacterized protein LOC119770135 n=1 Tax=Culex quinquefasciatus TaxID=7176 RepID=UPI0018E34CBB|nr:uncharacterized protein LOC119770135 [Culex quinquefasciatus]